VARWQNFQIWRGRLPHWRADDVTYYVTFRHKRPLEDDERSALLKRLLTAEGRKFEYAILCVLPEKTEMMFTVADAPKGGKYELSDVVEKAKAKAGKDVTKKSGERWPPFYHESYDRILRDDAEYEDTFLRILSSPTEHELAEDPSDYPHLFVPSQSH
jgi:hypothetical protein